jgi:hypothetical protein
MVLERGKRRQAKVKRGNRGTRDWTLCLLGSTATESIDTVVAGGATDTPQYVYLGEVAETYWRDRGNLG